ncbi:MAG: hypothetical protein HRT88_12855 [Lentisphaeraceae bacterium]|nr:hypothetical protein [Lentisphaeraceae bacterium]
MAAGLAFDKVTATTFDDCAPGEHFVFNEVADVADALFVVDVPVGPWLGGGGLVGLYKE